MGHELAKAYIQIIPTVKGLKSSLEKELSGDYPPVKDTGRKIGDGIVSGVSKTVKVGFAAAGTVAAGAFTASIAKGFKRLQTIENASKALEGMGLTAAGIKQVMQDANLAVKGTAFGLGEAAQAAKGLTAAGIKPGKEMERILRLVGDTAAQSGENIASMGAVWNKIAAKGKLTGEEAAQLLERGIPVWQALSQHMGITAEQAMDLASKSKISFNDFATSMEKMFGGSALAMGNTVKGSFDNMGAALGRFGAALLKEFYPLAVPALKKITETIDALTVKVTPLAVAGRQAFDRFTGALNTSVKGSQSYLELFIAKKKN